LNATQIHEDATFWGRELGGSSKSSSSKSSSSGKGGSKGSGSGKGGSKGSGSGKGKGKVRTCRLHSIFIVVLQ